MRNPIQCRIEDEIERACRRSIITNPDYLDDEQLTRERPVYRATAGDEGRVRVESRVESGVESLREKAVLQLVSGPKLKSEIAQGLGKAKVSGQIHRLVSRLLVDGFIERTIPDKRNSRLQKYRLTARLCCNEERDNAVPGNKLQPTKP